MNTNLSNNTRNNLYYALDETIFYCEQVKSLLDIDDDTQMYSYLCESFNVTRKLCRILSFAVKLLKTATRKG